MAAEKQSLKKVACEAIDNCASELRQINKQLWENPELSFQEVFAHKLLTEFLAAKGFNVTPKWSLETAFAARSGGDTGPCVGVICEYDALPEVGHACGHNLIAEAGVAAGIGIKAALASVDNSLGQLLILGTPAEEDGNGKVDMIKNGCFKEVDFCMMVHPTPYDSTVPSVLAENGLVATYTGHSAHAAAFPWEGVNALDAVVMAYSNMSVMRQQMKPSWRVHSIITEGGVRTNIIPERCQLSVEYRVPSHRDLGQLKNKIVGCLEGAAKATGCTLEMTPFYSEPTKDLLSNTTMASLYQSNAESLGLQFPSLEEQRCKLLGSTDMGNVSHVVPSIHPLYSIDSTAVNHTHAFTAATGSDVAHDKTLVAAKAMAMTAIDLFYDAKLRDIVKQEFVQTTS